MSYARTQTEWRKDCSAGFKPLSGRHKATSAPTGREPQTFLLLDGDCFIDAVQALTKSEARALLKAKIRHGMRVMGKAEHMEQLERQKRKLMKQSQG